MKITVDSHLDHALTARHLDYVVAEFGAREGFFTATVILPDSLESLPCGLHGPILGDAPVPDSECRMVVRGNRDGASRVCDRQPRVSRQLTLIAGPHGDDSCILYTAFGGPLAPREPWDTTLDDAGRAESVAFWAQHALSAE